MVRLVIYQTLIYLGIFAFGICVGLIMMAPVIRTMKQCILALLADSKLTLAFFQMDACKGVVSDLILNQVLHTNQMVEDFLRYGKKGKAIGRGNQPVSDSETVSQ